jgi:hypothetical protein
MILSKQEEYLISLLRELKPYEAVTINKDKDGKPNTYLVQRSQKIMVSELSINAVK